MSYGTHPDTPADVQRVEDAMVKKYGTIGDSITGLPFAWTESMANLSYLIEKHPDWFFKRIGAGHPWEVRNGLKDKTYYGRTLALAICRALLDLP